MTRIRRHRDEMAALLARREDEGLTWAALAEESGVPLSTLTYWRRKLEANDDAGAKASKQSFVELLVEPTDLPLPSTGIDLVTPSGHRFSIGREFDADTLRRLLAALSC